MHAMYDPTADTDNRVRPAPLTPEGAMIVGTTSVKDQNSLFADLVLDSIGEDTRKNNDFLYKLTWDVAESWTEYMWGCIMQQHYYGRASTPFIQTLFLLVHSTKNSLLIHLSHSFS